MKTGTLPRRSRCHEGRSVPANSSPARVTPGRRLNDWYYVYKYKNGRYLYERTCGSEESAQRLVSELVERGVKAVYLINHMIKGAFY